MIPVDLANFEWKDNLFNIVIHKKNLHEKEVWVLLKVEIQ